MIEKLHIDIETYSSVDIKKSGAYKYVESIDFEILLVAYAYDDAPIQIVDLAAGEELPKGLIHYLKSPDVKKYAHNAAFERIALKKHGINTSIEGWRCSMIKSAYCGLPLSLKDVSKALHLEDKSKDTAGTALIKYFCMPVKPTKVNDGRVRNFYYHDSEKWENFKAYCMQDVEAERTICDILEPYRISVLEQALYTLDQKINDRGIKIDISMAEAAVNIDNIFTESIKQEIKDITGVENPNSVAQLKAWLGEAIGKEITSLAKDKIEILLEEIDCDAVLKVLELRQKISKSSNKKYNAMLNCYCEDERARGLFQFYGANRTGRWAGRLIQLQNLPRNYIDHLEFARDIVKQNDAELMSMMYDNTSSILSELVRTTFIAEEGKTFAVADFAAIEARVIAWLAGEEWRLEVFRTHGKIYEASAAMMFNVDIEEVTKGSELRNKGKVAELALGYQGAVGALTKMGGESMGLSEQEMDTIVKKWRHASPNIVDLWKSVENAAKRALRNKRKIIDTPHKGLKFYYDGVYLTIQLPSKRKLFYYSPTFTLNKFEQESIKYKGMNQTTKQWQYIDTYGGKFVENCLAGDTKVLTPQGWKRLDCIELTDQIWDGEKWQNHKGLTYKKLKEVITVDGVKMTPDHKILTKNEIWKNASQGARYFRHEVKLPDSYKIQRLRRQEISMVNKVRLRKRDNLVCIGVSKKQTTFLRMHEIRDSEQSQKHSQDVKTSNLRSMEIYEIPMHEPQKQSLSKLRRPRYKSLPRMARKFRKFLNRHAPIIQTWARFGQDKQQRRVFQRELPLDYKTAEQQESTNKHSDRNSPRKNDNCRSFRNIKRRSNNSVLQNKKQLSCFKVIHQTRCKESVYDLLDCGPKHRFTVLGEAGPFIVHNCVQAIARDLLAEAMLRVSSSDFEISMHVHDEIVCEVPTKFNEKNLDELCNLMSVAPEWAKGLPLAADGYITPFYKKD